MLHKRKTKQKQQLMDLKTSREKMLTSVACGEGYGLAVCEPLDLVATSNALADSVSLFSIRRAATAGGKPVLDLVHTFQNAGPPHHRLFHFKPGSFPGIMPGAGALAFMPGTHRLLVASYVNGVVHVLDPVTLQHAGHMARGGMRPRGVAASHTMVAASCWQYYDAEAGIVVFAHAPTPDRPCNFVHTRTVHLDKWQKPLGLRFVDHGTKVVVADQRGLVHGYVPETGESLGCLRTDKCQFRDVEVLDPELWTQGRWLFVTVKPGGMLCTSNGAWSRAWKSQRMQSLAFLPGYQWLIVRHPGHVAVHDVFEDLATHGWRASTVCT
jgi:hypothetical protein